MAVADVEELDRLSADLAQTAATRVDVAPDGRTRRSRIPTRTASFWWSRTPPGSGRRRPPMDESAPSRSATWSCTPPTPPPWRASPRSSGSTSPTAPRRGCRSSVAPPITTPSAFFASGDGGLQHLAFDVATTDAVMSGVAQLREHGVHPIWGPGRHGPGDNVFAYFEDPAGHIMSTSVTWRRSRSTTGPRNPGSGVPSTRRSMGPHAGPPPPQFGRGRPSGASSRPSGGEG